MFESSIIKTTILTSFYKIEATIANKKLMLRIYINQHKN
jgi:hypothetical protein